MTLDNASIWLIVLLVLLLVEVYLEPHSALHPISFIARGLYLIGAVGKNKALFTNKRGK